MVLFMDVNDVGAQLMMIRFLNSNTTIIRFIINQPSIFCLKYIPFLTNAYLPLSLISAKFYYSMIA